MPDLICPPVWTPEPCSCRGVRLGVGLLALCAYSAAFSTVFFGQPLAAVVADAMRGDVPVIWTACAVFGVLSLVGGLYQIRRDGHGFKAGSFVWSCGVVALVAWRLPALVDWFASVSGLNYHSVRMLLVAWAASNASNILLQLGEVLGWRLPRFARRSRPEVQPVRQAAGLLHSRSVTAIETFEVEGGGIEAALEVLRHAAPHSAPGFIEGGGGVPQIEYVQDENGVAVMPPARNRVPVRRR